MYSMVMFVLDEADFCHDILNAWEEAGIFGVTILDSSGLGRVRSAVREDMPLIPSLSDLFKNSETQHKTLFTVVDDDKKVDAIVKATESVVGNLEESNTGFLFVMPVSRVYGRSKR